MADSPVRLNCIGGFVVTQLYGLDRATADIDVIELAPPQIAATIFGNASKGSPLAKIGTTKRCGGNSEFRNAKTLHSTYGWR